MRYLMRAGAMSCLALAATTVSAQDEGGDTGRGLTLSPVQIFADEGVAGVPGSASVVEDFAIERRRPATTLDTMQSLPGVNVVSEDPLGRRPNVGIRGLNPRRSRKMHLMEDGAPIQLAPYSDSSANYQPAPRRLRRVEAVKGSGTIKYGPQTIGGSINYLTRNPPREPEVVLYGAAGNRGFIDTNVSAGGTYGNTGLLVDFIHQSQDGFRRGEQQIINDFMFKSVTELEPGHRLTFKATTYNENQRGGEAGYSEEQFSNSRRENPLPQDRFEVERIAGQIIHEYDFTNRTSLATNFYANKTERTSRRQASDSSGLLNCPDGPEGQGDDSIREDFANADQCGNQIRPRDFRVMGVEPRLTHEYEALGYDHRVVTGFRYHEERAERRQFWGNSPGTDNRQCDKLEPEYDEDGNVIGLRNDCRDDRFDVTATSFFVQNTTQVGNFAITPGARFERWELKESAQRGEGSRETETRRFNEFLPGISVSYGGFETFEIFGGVHRGISPATTDVEPDPEIGNIFEVGVRTTPAAPVTGEVSLFYIDYRDLIASDRDAEGDIDNFNAGRARMRGIEFSGRVDSWAFFDTDWNVYLLANATVLDTEFKNSVEGELERGNDFPFAPRFSGYMALGYEVGRFDARLGVQHVGRQFVDNENTRDRVPDGDEGRIASFTVLDASVNYLVRDGLTVFVAGRNLADREYVANRVGGITPGVRRQVYGGFEARF
ncbi:TonB-dependent receptor [Methylonatrum kenyense]|uniref:TonB-dependent receptor family protein n=1 Tax=Methylonatrum kenyense TaxID=455253 RepID=UPI0020BF5CC6|nr:TonB-dependent receptor [Methylonatrum kenyense]MCK8516696.1 TonB-dependent receptor [Methylonatrum kenyense]